MAYLNGKNETEGMRGTSKINFNAFTAVYQILQCFEKGITLNNQVVRYRATRWAVEAWKNTISHSL